MTPVDPYRTLGLHVVGHVITVHADSALISAVTITFIVGRDTVHVVGGRGVCVQMLTRYMYIHVSYFVNSVDSI